MKCFLFFLAAAAAASTFCAAATSEELDHAVVDAVIDLHDFECDEEPQRPLEPPRTRLRRRISQRLRSQGACRSGSSLRRLSTRAPPTNHSGRCRKRRRSTSGSHGRCRQLDRGPTAAVAAASAAARAATTTRATMVRAPATSKPATAVAR